MNLMKNYHRKENAKIFIFPISKYSTRSLMFFRRVLFYNLFSKGSLLQVFKNNFFWKCHEYFIRSGKTEKVR